MLLDKIDDYPGSGDSHVWEAFLCSEEFLPMSSLNEVLSCSSISNLKFLVNEMNKAMAPELYDLLVYFNIEINS